MTSVGRSADEGYSVQANQLARRLLRYQRNRHQLGAWLHPSRRDLNAHALLEGGDCIHPVHADLWLTAAGVPPPSLEAFSQGAQALYGLSVANMVCLARLRALYAYAGELRHWVDSRRRGLLAAWLGPYAAQWIRGILIEIVADAPSCIAVAPGTLETCPADGLAWQGYCLLLRDGALNNEGPCALIPLALDATLACGVPPICERADDQGSAAIARLAVRQEDVLA